MADDVGNVIWNVKGNGNSRKTARQEQQTQEIVSEAEQGDIDIAEN